LPCSVVLLLDHLILSALPFRLPAAAKAGAGRSRMRGDRRSKATRPLAPPAISERDMVEDSRLVKQVRELRRLVPVCREPCGLGELFQDTATYIEDLQVQVKVMRMLLDKLSDE